MVNPLLCVLGLTLSLAADSSYEEKKAAPELTFYVSPQGSDQNPGTQMAPFASIRSAQQAVRKALQRNQATTITVICVRASTVFTRHLYSIRKIQPPMAAV